MKVILVFAIWVSISDGIPIEPGFFDQGGLLQKIASIVSTLHPSYGMLPQQGQGGFVNGAPLGIQRQQGLGNIPMNQGYAAGTPVGASGTVPQMSQSSQDYSSGGLNGAFGAAPQDSQAFQNGGVPQGNPSMSAAGSGLNPSTSY